MGPPLCPQCTEETSMIMEPMTNCSLLHLSLNTTFFIAITLARRIGELGALMAVPSIYSVSLWQGDASFSLSLLSHGFLRISHQPRDSRACFLSHASLFHRRNGLSYTGHKKSSHLFTQMWPGLSGFHPGFYLNCKMYEKTVDFHPNTIQIGYRLHFKLLQSLRGWPSSKSHCSFH